MTRRGSKRILRILLQLCLLNFVMTLQTQAQLHCKATAKSISIETRDQILFAVISNEIDKHQLIPKKEKVIDRSEHKKLAHPEIFFYKTVGILLEKIY